jgi:hypothetical protein
MENVLVCVPVLRFASHSACVREVLQFHTSLSFFTVIPISSSLFIAMLMTVFYFFAVATHPHTPFHQAPPKSGVPRSGGGGAHITNADAYFESHQKDVQVRACVLMCEWVCQHFRVSIRPLN